MHGKFLPPTAAETKKQQVQRAAIMGQLAGGVLHDFNNILTVITGTIEILAEAGGENFPCMNFQGPLA